MLYFELLVIFILSLFNGFLAMSELAIISARRARIKFLPGVSERQKRAVAQLKEDPGRFLSTVQIGITLIGIAAGAFSGATLAGRLGNWLNAHSFIAPYGHTVAIVATIVGITYLSLILGEILPKRIALIHPERIAALIAGPMHRLSLLASPAVWILKISTETLMGFFGISEVGKAKVSEEEIKYLIAEGTQLGVFKPQEKEMIDGVLRMADRPVRIIMTPRSEMAWLEVNASSREVFDTFSLHHHSRLLVCEGSIERPIGLAHAKDILLPVLKGEDFDLRSLMRPVLFVPESVSVLKLTELFKQKKMHVAVVIDEHGTTEGMITLTDVLESIAGDMPEYDEEPEWNLVRREDGSWLVDGDLPIDEFEARTGLAGLSQIEGVYTIAGFIMHRLERVPETGTRFHHGNALFEVVDMDGRRIDKVLVKAEEEPPPPPEPGRG